MPGGLILPGNPRAAALFKAIAEGFQQTRLEILLFFLLVIALMLFFTLFFVARKRAVSRELRRRSLEMFEHLLSRLHLEAEETNLVDRLVQQLPRGEPEHALLVSRHAFDASARRLREEGVPKGRLDALRSKIGFRLTDRDDIPESSAELPEGSTILLVSGSGAKLHSRIVSQGPAFMTVSVDPSAMPGIGARLRAYFYNGAGVFSFLTRVDGHTADTAQLPHSWDIKRYQRRTFYRRKESLPVRFRLASTKSDFREGVLLDLGGGGASFRDPSGLSKRGDLLDLLIAAKDQDFQLSARVVRVSKAGGVSVRFEFVSDAQRNRIMNFLFRQAQRGQT